MEKFFGRNVFSGPSGSSVEGKIELCEPALLDFHINSYFISFWMFLFIYLLLL